MATTEIQ